MTKNDKTASLEYERWYQAHKDYQLIAGIDEAGRGAWAGPVAAGAVCLPLARADLSEVLEGVRDSKIMTRLQRERLVEVIQTTALAWGVGSASSTEIDDIGIVPATKLAMQRALDQLLEHEGAVQPQCLFLDSMAWDDCAFDCDRVNIRKGDRHSLSIAAASVLAKVWRDEHMRQMEAEHPGYEFAAHKGYGTAKHRAALKLHGPTTIHRMYYKPLQDLTRSADMN